MPLRKIYHPKDAYTVEEKKAFANAISDVYGRQMPRFYVGVLFQEVEADNFYVGGEPNGNFVRIWVDHIARTLPDDEARRNFTKYIAKVVAPWVENRSWELHVDETPFDLWTIQGYLPPRQGTDDEARWISDNKPSPRTHE
jgi:phenylpyruvate tautomerase PptA (4-oxalocrotonate tautomerase family)